MTKNSYIVQMKNIVKKFPGVIALKDVNLDVLPGEVIGLVGENGAGKSTLMNCLIGVHSPTSGEIWFDGKKQGQYSTIDALSMGISMIHQELSPVLHRPIMENLWLGREPRNKFGFVDHKKMNDMSVDLLRSLEIDDDPRKLVKELTVAKIQMLEIAKAVSYNAKVIIMDEPTSALTGKEINELYKTIRKLKAEGKAIIYISHKLDEIYEITDKVVVLRDGQYIGTEKTKGLEINKMIAMMVGREVKEMFPKVQCEISDVKLEVKGLTSKKFSNVSFDVRKGEIFGIAGLIGSGRTELIETIFGARQKTDGEIYIDNKLTFIKNPSDAIKNRMALLTEDRRQTGIIPMLSVKENMTIANMNRFINKIGFLRHKKIKDECGKFVDSIQIKTPSIMQKIKNLSGGNQQKVLVARWLMTEPDILFLDEPTRGIDVGAKAEIHRLITKLAGQGKSIVMVSSELPEILGMSDRILVMHEGRVTGILDNEKGLAQEVVMQYATAQVE